MGEEVWASGVWLGLRERLFVSHVIALNNRVDTVTCQVAVSSLCPLLLQRFKKTKQNVG